MLLSGAAAVSQRAVSRGPDRQSQPCEVYSRFSATRVTSSTSSTHPERPPAGSSRGTLPHGFSSPFFPHSEIETDREPPGPQPRPSPGAPQDPLGPRRPPAPPRPAEPPQGPGPAPRAGRADWLRSRCSRFSPGSDAYCRPISAAPPRGPTFRAASNFTTRPNSPRAPPPPADTTVAGKGQGASGHGVRARRDGAGLAVFRRWAGCGPSLEGAGEGWGSLC